MNNNVIKLIYTMTVHPHCYDKISLLEDTLYFGLGAPSICVEYYRQ